MKGVTQRTYDAWRKRQALAVQDVRKISNEEIRAIYRRDYWDAVSCDNLPSGLDICAFDFAVNSGPARAKAYVRKYNVPGAYPADIINSFCQARLAFVRSLRTWATFGKGWQRRISVVNKYALAHSSEMPQEEAWLPDPLPQNAATGATPAPMGSLMVSAIVAVVGALQLVPWGIVIENPKMGGALIGVAIFNALRLAVVPAWARIFIPEMRA